MNQIISKPSIVSGMAGRPTRISIALCISIAMAGMGGCKKKEPVAAGAVPVKLKVLAPEEVIVSSRFSGSIVPLQTTSLAFKLAGTVQRLYRPPGLDRDVQVGDTLAKGTVIAELDEGDLRRAKASTEARVAQLEARVVTAKETLTIATRNFERFVNSSGAVSQAARDEADAKRVAAAGELASAEHSLADARVQLDQANDNYLNRQLIVPFDNATVAEKHIEPGERKQAQEVAFRLIDISTVHITFGVPDTMIGEPAIRAATDRVSLGQKLQVTADAFEGRSLAATVTKISPQADQQTRTFLTELTLPNPQLPDGRRLLRPGMIVTVRVGAENDRRVMLLPMAAIHQGRTADELVVYAAATENGREVARMRKVALGGVYNNEVELLPGGSEIRPGDSVVVSTAERLSDGATVRSIQDNLTTAPARPEGQ
jgi:RND family efflux transporter MFP subunit